jgi:hypothetical protein
MSATLRGIVYVINQPRMSCLVRQVLGSIFRHWDVEKCIRRRCSLAKLRNFSAGLIFTSHRNTSGCQVEPRDVIFSATLVSLSSPLDSPRTPNQIVCSVFLCPTWLNWLTAGHGYYETAKAKHACADNWVVIPVVAPTEQVSAGTYQTKQKPRRQ